MCGIAGFNRAARSKRNAKQLAVEMALAIEQRGHHATGAGWTEQDWPFFWKEEGAARRVVRSAPVPRDTGNLILHTRYATHGDVSQEVNNHPHVVPGIVLVHNGTLSNYRELMEFADYTPQGECDSEAIPALLAAFPEEHPADLLPLLEGRAAVAWIATDDPDTLHLARVTGSPLVTAQDRIGNFYFSSTLPLLYKALNRLDIDPVWTEEVPEGTYIRVRGGRVSEVTRFAVKHVEVDRRLTLMTEGGR